MMYQPVLETSIPAFIKEKLEIPFMTNRGNIIEQIEKIELVIYSIYNRALTPPIEIFNIQGDLKSRQGKIIVDLTNNINIDPSLIKEGSFYKFQIRFFEKNDLNNPSNWSFMTSGKCIAKPLIIIEGFETDGVTYALQNSYVGLVNYSNANLGIDKIFQYKFSILDNQNNVVDTTDWQYHMSDQDNLEEKIFKDNYIPRTSLKENNLYFLKYEIITENNYTTSFIGNIMAQKYYDDLSLQDLGLQISAAADNDNGCIDITISSLGEENKKAISGDFVINRYDNKNGWQQWFSFSIVGKRNVFITKKDWWIEQGVEYLYSLQKKNKHNIYTKHYSIEKPVICNFEDMFLVDKEKSLKLRFSPTMSSYKTFLQESKIETLGSKYPFFMRNGVINYKEMPIGGKISYLMDNDYLFMTPEELNLEITTEKSQIDNLLKLPTTNLTSENIHRERIFKNAVLDWLNNGKPKMLKTATEGCFIVRGMNFSMNPETQLGRMLHSFSGTVYEVADLNYKNLLDLDILSLDYSKTWNNLETSDFYVKSVLLPQEGNLLNNELADSFKIENATPGSYINIEYEDNSTQSIMIGSTGKYKSPKLETKIKSFIINSSKGEVIFTINYKMEETEFDKVTSIYFYNKFKTIEGSAAADKKYLSQLLLDNNSQSFVIQKIQFYIEDYSLLENSNSVIKIKYVNGPADGVDIDIAAADYLSLSKDDFDIIDIIYPDNCIVRTECYYLIEEMKKED